MGQISSIQDASSPSVQAAESKGSDHSENYEKVSEKVKCVKTRIDMLIEDCLNAKEGTDCDKSEPPDEPERKSPENNSYSEDSKPVDIVTVEDKCCKSEGEEENEKKEGQDNKDESNKHVASVDCCDKDDLSSAKDSKSEKPATTKIDLSEIIKDSVNTELTQTQLRQIRQRTITTFNTFIDKVLDNSLNQEIANEEPKTNSNILKLCSESMNAPPELPPEKKVPIKNKPEPTGNNTSSTPEKSGAPSRNTITLKEHIERFLEISFREECLENDNNMPETKVSLPENFNAQGLVNSMITQGLKVDKLLTKDKPNNQSQKSSSVKEEDRHSGRIVRVNEPSHSTMSNPGQKGSNVRHYSDIHDRRNHDIASHNHHLTESRMREQYLNASKMDPAQRMPVHPGYRMEEMMERNRDIQQKMAFDNMALGARAPGHVASFQHPHLHMGNNAYLHPAYGPRMQLSPGRREMKSPVSRDGKIHPRDCGCPYCIQMPQHCLDIPVPDHHSGKHSPLVPHALFEHGMAVQSAMAGHLRDVPVSMMKPVREMSPAMSGYHGMHKLMPHNPSITASKVYSSTSHLVPGDIPPQAMMSGRRHGVHETGSYYFPQRGGENVPPAERVAIRSGKRSPYQVRPSSVPSQEHSSRPGSGYRSTDSEHLRSSDSLSGASDCSNEAPLDLTVKKPNGEPSMRNRSSSNGANVRKINPSITFIKHLESSVDRHWQELSSSPPLSPVQQQQRPVTHHTPNAGKNRSSPYPRSSPNGSPPSTGMMSMLSNRPLRSPHFMGGITVGQPLVDIKPQVTQKQNENPYNAHQTAPPVTSSPAQSQQHFQGNQSNADVNSKRSSSNNVSKHEPIQNIIGNNDPNDILYLICRLCTQTYGSPYGFRKHFRNQHGFEPRAEHTIVQTISATKTALHLPQPPTVQGMANFHESQRARKSMSPEDGGSESSKISVGGSIGRRDSPASPADSRSIAGSEDSEKCDIENSETKFLECPECGKTFQLNDFGSYKRHCRQHGSVKMNVYTCSDCHLPFPDQKLLREHYIMHVKEGGPHGIKQEKPSGEGFNPKHGKSSMKCYACVKCDVQFDKLDLYQAHINRHSTESQGSGSERSNSTKSEQKMNLSVKSEKDSFSNIITSTNITIQAAESMTTSSVCPDSSWDNVTKTAAASSDKVESMSAELSESGHSNMSNCSEKVSTAKDENKSGSNSPSVHCSRQKSMESGSDTSEDKNDEFLYKHKKFFHHRKRANSNLSVESTEPKQTKLGTESSNSMSSDDLSGNSNVGTSSKSMDSPSEKQSPVTVSDKPVKTEARHSSLPFVWDRSSRSQKKSS